LEWKFEHKNTSCEIEEHIYLITKMVYILLYKYFFQQGLDPSTVL